MVPVPLKVSVATVLPSITCVETVGVTLVPVSVFCSRKSAALDVDDFAEADRDHVDHAALCVAIVDHDGLNGWRHGVGRDMFNGPHIDRAIQDSVESFAALVEQQRIAVGINRQIVVAGVDGRTTG